VFVASRVVSYAGQLELGELAWTDWVGLAACAAIYGTANTLLAEAWRLILSYLGASIDRSAAVKTYGTSQIAKYVPGNVFHFASRQLLGLSRSIAGAALAKSVVFELATISAAALWLGILALPFLFPFLPRWSGAVAFAGAFPIIFVIVRGRFGSAMIKSVLYYALFLATAGALFIAIAAIVAPVAALHPGLIPGLIAAYVVAWLAGLLTPGAPAGVGVREFVLLFLLGEHIGEATLLLAVLLHRLITLVGDLGFFGVASLLSVSPSTRSG
jgi:hypothetical protein